MTPERWQQITDVFHSALMRDAAGRIAFLDEACASDDALRAEVEAMLEAHRDAGSFGDAPAFTASVGPSDFVTAGKESVVSDLQSAVAPPLDPSDAPRLIGIRHLTWWMIVITASSAATFVFFWYLTIWGPADALGIVATFAGDAMELRSLAPDSPFEKACLRAGDRVLTIDDQPMRVPRDWTAATGNMRVAQQSQALPVCYRF